MAFQTLASIAAAWRDFVQRRRAAATTNRELLARLQAVMARAPVAIGFTRHQRFEMLSEQFYRLLGYAEGELLGRSPQQVFVSETAYLALGEQVRQAFGAGVPLDTEIEFVRRDGHIFWGRLQSSPVRWNDPGAGTIWTLEDVTEARRQREALSWSSTHDALTELINRREFERRLAKMVGNRRRDVGSALFIDLDHFKAVNDSAGHAAGDRLLIEIARLLLDQVRTSDTVARLGGDEFAVLLPVCDRNGAACIAEKMRQAIEAYRLPWGGQRFGVGACFGVVELDRSVPDVPTALAAADAACYAAKRAGRNRVQVYRREEADTTV
jgi:diguanylate cyclase (GGDEF)-like protein/PAS domain S-box-containing protein